MTTKELKRKIRTLVPKVYQTSTSSVPSERVEFEIFTQFPELKDVIIDLLTSDYVYFISSIDWVAPRPTTFKINLKNGLFFYLIWNEKSWIAQVSGKKYYLLNLPEQQRASTSISRLLRYTLPSPETQDEMEDEFDEEGEEETPPEIEDEFEDVEDL
jgi:hypothetical protein